MKTVNLTEKELKLIQEALLTTSIKYDYDSIKCNQAGMYSWGSKVTTKSKEMYELYLNLNNID